jgi:hypothetical protein
VAQTTGGRDALLLERDRELQRIAGFLQRGQQGHGGALVVEGHLTNVFNKLDVTARTELPTALATPTQAVRG